MRDSSAVVKLPLRQLFGIGLAALICLALALAAGCGSDPTATPEPTPAPPTATPAPPAATPEPQAGADSDSDEGGGEDGDEQSSASSSEDSTDNGSEDSDNGDSDSSGSGNDGTVSQQNPGGEGTPFDNSRNVALFGTEPLDAVTWTVEPVITPGELVAEGVLEQGAILFDPTVDGEGSGFSVFYKGHEESMVELLPDLGPMFVWDTFQTVAPTEMEIEGASFKIRAYSPLFMEVSSGDLELRVYGYDQSGADALLAVIDISGSDSGGTASQQNPGDEGTPFDNSRNVALFGTEPLDAVTWTVEPVITPGELVAEGVLEQGAILFDPTVDGEGSGFSVFYKGHEESMVELLPDLGPMFVWDTFQTVAPTEMEIEGASFKIRAYSPLFMDVGPGDLELRVYGYDQSGADALLAIREVKVE